MLNTYSLDVEFKSDLWKDHFESRTDLIKTILKGKLIIGKTRDELKSLLGQEDNYYYLDEWSYLIKNNLFGGKTYLLVYFTDEKVTKQKLRTIYSF